LEVNKVAGNFHFAPVRISMPIVCNINALCTIVAGQKLPARAHAHPRFGGICGKQVQRQVKCNFFGDN
jgi:hypothetical protein